MPVTHIPVVLTDVTTYTVLADNAGLVHYIPDLTADITITLPTPRAGLWYEFVYSGDAADTADWLITTGSDTNYYKGGLTFLDQDGDVVAPIDGDGNSNSKLTILTPEPGTRIRCECANGVNWFLSGHVLSATVPTFADQ
jgi:hypothetical protein